MAFQDSIRLMADKDYSGRESIREIISGIFYNNIIAPYEH